MIRERAQEQISKLIYSDEKNERKRKRHRIIEMKWHSSKRRLR